MEIITLAPALLAATMSAGAALAGEAVTDPAPYAASEHALIGPVWELDALDGEPSAAGIETTLTFSREGQIGGNGGCNAFGGDYNVSGGTLSFSNIFSTMMACPDQETPQEQVFLAALEATQAFEIVEGELLLKDAGDAVLARLAPQ
jgi:putative lipoprotein